MKWVLIGILLLVAAFILSGPIMSNVEQSKYTVVESFDDIEIRDYSPMIVAEVHVTGARQDAINQGFQLLARYLFGDNKPHNKIAMTAPVMQESSEQGWEVRFVMPSSYSMQTLPKPNSTAIKLIPIAAKRFVVIRFSGVANAENLNKNQQKLMAFVGEKKLKPISDPIYAFFNPPWTAPSLRRNEIMVEIPF